MLPPGQKVAEPLILAEGGVLTVTVVVVISAHCPAVGVNVRVIAPLKPDGLKLLPVTPEPLHAPVIPLCVVLSVMGVALAHKADKGDSVTGLLALTVIVNVWAVPVQVGEEPTVGVTVMVALIGVVPALVAVKEAILPEPLAAKPIAVLLLDQLNEAPADPVKAGIVTVAPSQTAWSAGSVTVGSGLTVMVKVCGVPGQPDIVGVTVIVATTGVVPAFVAVNAAILPVPLAAKPMLGVLFVQLKVAPAVPLKVTAVVFAPAQTIWSVGSVTVGVGVTVTWWVSVAVQPPALVTVTV